MGVPFWFRETYLGRLADFVPRRSRARDEDLIVDRNGSIEKNVVETDEFRSPSRSDEYKVVSWDGDADPEHPRNWSPASKAMVAVIVSIYSFIVYCGSSICIMSYEAMMQRFNHSREIVSLTLSLYVIGYGIGPMLFSPLSEMPRIGRNPPYVLSFVIFLVLSVVLGVLDNFPAIAILRLLQGFFGSPCLATAGASIFDVYPMEKAPYGLIVWVACIYCGPALGPLFAAHALDLGWHWPMWQIAIMSAFCLVMLVCFLPETQAETLLIHRAQRLRRATGNPHFLAPGELQKSHMSLPQALLECIKKPAEISIEDPAMGFTAVYTAFLYSIYYSFFEAFPQVYPQIYHFSAKAFGAIFVSIVVGCAVFALIYLLWIYYLDARRTARNEPYRPGFEADLRPALPATVLTPISLFVFAWTSRASIHWVVPTLGIAVYSGATFIIYQTLLLYLPQSYPKYSASLFAANDFLRSSVAAVIIMVSPYMYTNLGIAKGVTILASISVLGIAGMGVLVIYGAKMRARSKFTAE